MTVHFEQVLQYFNQMPKDKMVEYLEIMNQLFSERNTYPSLEVNQLITALKNWDFLACIKTLDAPDETGLKLIWRISETAICNSLAELTEFLNLTEQGMVLAKLRELITLHHASQSESGFQEELNKFSEISSAKLQVMLSEFVDSVGGRDAAACLPGFKEVNSLIGELETVAETQEKPRYC